MEHVKGGRALQSNIQANLLCYFLLKEKTARFKSVQHSIVFLLYIKVKINKHEICKLDSSNFEMSKIYQGNFQSSCRLAQLFVDTSAGNLQKTSEIVGENFSSYENAIWSIILKSQEIDVQIQITDEI